MPFQAYLSNTSFDADWQGRDKLHQASLCRRQETMAIESKHRT